MRLRIAIPAWLVGVVLAQFVAATALRAQRPTDVGGVVIDSVSRRPIARAHIDIFEQPKSGPRVPKGQTLTDGAGRFRIEVAALPSAVLEVRQIGFVPRSVILDSARLRDMLTIVLARTPTTLGGVRVVGTAGATQRQLELSGFVDRQKVGIGKFLDSTSIARRDATSLVSLLRPYLKGCTMIFVDATPGRLGDVEISRVIGIEIYASNLEAPSIFRNPIESSKGCGSIAVWTR